RFISRPNRRGLVEISPYLEALLHPSARHGVAIPAELCRNTTVVMAISPATRGIGTGGVGLPRPNL
ncbi:MAG: hypothetical protein N3A38_03380, partial [Planctomycetota bacterium]|nr:hypothetical protein [Planctomycetota bacterium]